MDDKEQEKRLMAAALAAASADVASRYGGAVKEHFVAYSGVDSEAGQTLKRSLKGISQSNVNPDFEKSNLKQQAGFSAEVKEVARRRAEERIAGKTPSTMRTDDIPGHVNDELYDITCAVDAAGNPVPGASAQMKFVGSSPGRAVNKMLGKDYEKYIDNDCQMLVPSDYYDGMKAALKDKCASLEKQVESLRAQGKTEAAEAKQAQLEKCRKLSKNLRKSKVSNAEAMEARTKPKLSTAKDIARVSHRAGIAQAKTGAAIGGSISLIRNFVSVCKGEKEAKDALRDMGCDTASAAALSYATGAGGALLKGAMQNAKTSALRSVSKTNLPAMIVSGAVDAGKSLKRYFAGEIDGAECMEELGEKGYESVASALFAAIGQAAIPVPVVGALAGSMIGFSLSSLSYRILTDSLRDAKLARERRVKIEAECAEAVKMIREYRTEMETAVRRYMSDMTSTFDDAFSRIDKAVASGDIDGYMSGMNAITVKLGGRPQFSNMREFDAFMMSDEPLVL